MPREAWGMEGWRGGGVEGLEAGGGMDGMTGGVMSPRREGGAVGEVGRVCGGDAAGGRGPRAGVGKRECPGHLGM